MCQPAEIVESSTPSVTKYPIPLLNAENWITLFPFESAFSKFQPPPSVHEIARVKVVQLFKYTQQFTVIRSSNLYLEPSEYQLLWTWSLAPIYADSPWSPATFMSFGFDGVPMLITSFTSPRYVESPSPLFARIVTFLSVHLAKSVWFVGTLTIVLSVTVSLSKVVAIFLEFFSILMSLTTMWFMLISWMFAWKT